MTLLQELKAYLQDKEISDYKLDDVMQILQQDFVSTYKGDEFMFSKQRKDAEKFLIEEHKFSSIYEESMAILSRTLENLVNTMSAFHPSAEIKKMENDYRRVKESVRDYLESKKVISKEDFNINGDEGLLV